jgi:hypothetical protein
MLLEWGWNNFNRESLIDISQIGKFATFDPETSTYRTNDESEDVFENLFFLEEENSYVKTSHERRGILDAFSNPGLFEEGTDLSGGNYDGMVGQITNFSYTFNEATLTYECTTEIASNSKYYMALAVRNLTYITDKKDETKSKEIKGFKEYWSDTFVKDVMNAYSNPNYLIQGVSLDGRAFIPNKYFSEVFKQKKTQHSDLTYVTIGFFVELLSKYIAKTGKITPINLEDVFIGAHPNMISTSLDVLIPNALTPKYLPEKLYNNPDASPSSTKIKTPKNDETPMDAANRLMESVLNNGQQRENLNVMLNSNRGGDVSNYAFPIISNKKNNKDDDDKQSLYKGKLSNIFISTQLIKQICNQPDIKTILTALCSRLNDVGVVWGLEAICSDNNTIKIIDNRFTDVALLKKAKDLLGVDSVIYYLDTTSQLSVVRGFKFDVKLSDAIANSIVAANQANKFPDNNQTLDNRVTWRVPDDVEVSDLIVPELEMQSKREIKNAKTLERNQKIVAAGGAGKFNEQVAKASIAEDEKKAKEVGNPETKELGNIDKDCLYCETEKNGIKRFTLSDKYKSKYQAMLNDDTAQFVNVNSMPIPGTTAEFSVNGIGGFKTFQIYGVKALPKPYQDNIIFKIKEVNHVISDNDWNTTIISTIVPARDLQKLI